MLWSIATPTFFKNSKGSVPACKYSSGNIGQIFICKLNIHFCRGELAINRRPVLNQTEVQSNGSEEHGASGGDTGVSEQGCPARS